MQADGQNAVPSTPSAFSRLSTLNPQPLQIPDHELLCLIGRGAYGEVWLARNVIGTMRAVKIVHRQSFQRAEHFEREFKGLLKFEPISRSHDGLVDILQIGRRDDAGYFFYVMELADDGSQRPEVRNQKPDSKCGESNFRPLPSDFQFYQPRTLRSLLRSDLQPSTLNPQPATACLPPAECVALGLKLASALEHLHANGLVHRDIKPSNIIFVNGEPKLADIGLVTAIDEAHSLVGTVGYIPPEGPGTPQADLYSLGKVLYEIAFGKDRQDFPQLPPDLQSYPDYAALLELNEIILKACETDPRRRYASATALSKDLAMLQRGQSVKCQREVAHRFAIARKAILGVMVVALLFVGVQLVTVLKRGRAEDPKVVRLYDLGRRYHNQLTAVDCSNAVWHLSAALQIDPKFVPAYVELFEIYIWTFAGVAGTRDEQLHKIGDIANKLLAINPSLAEAHAALSYCKYLERDWHGAEEEIQRAIRLNPNYPMGHSLYGYYLSLLGRTDEALREVRRGEELDSASSRIAVLIGWYPFMAARQFDKAIAQLQQVVDLDKNFQMAHGFLGRCYEAQSNYLAAIEEFKMADLLPGEDSKTSEFYKALRQAYDTEGEPGYWRKNLEWCKEDEALPEEQRPSRDIAGCYAKLGEKEKALSELEEHFDEMTVWNALKFEPKFDGLHDEPRFKALLKKAGFEK